MGRAPKLLILSAAALLAAFLSSRAPRPNAELAPREAVARASGDLRELPAALTATRFAVAGPALANEEPPLSSDAANPPLPPSESVTPTVPPAAPWRLRVTLDGDELGTPAHVVVQARVDGDPFAGAAEVYGDVALGGAEVLEVSALFEPPVGARDASGPFAELVVRVTHPDYLEQLVTVALPQPFDRDDPPLEPLEARVSFAPHCTVHGRVACNGEARLDQTLVAVFRRDGARIQHRTLAHTSAASDGRFALKLPADGDFALVAVLEGRRPCSRRVELTRADEALDLGLLFIEDGATLSGTASLGGAPPREVLSIGAVLADADLERNGWSALPWHFSNGGGALCWIDGAFELFHVQAQVHGDGTFEVHGLAPRDYDLTCHGFAAAHNRARGPLTQRVRAPRADVRFDVSVALVDLRFEDGGLDHGLAPCEGTLRLEREGAAPDVQALFISELAQGQHRTFTFDPGERGAFVAEVPGRTPARIEFTAPAAGERSELLLRVEHDPNRPTTTLVLRPVGGALAEGAAVVVHVRPVTAAGVEGERWFGLEYDARAQRVLVRNGDLTLTDLTPGRWQVVAYPSQAVGQRGSLWLDARLEVDLAAGETRVLPLEFRAGGRLGVSAMGADGRLCTAAVEVFDARGEAVAVTFVAYAAGGGGGSSHTHVLEFGPSQVVPNLAAGRYRLVCTPHTDSAPLAQDVDVRPGEVRDVVFQLP